MRKTDDDFDSIKFLNEFEKHPCLWNPSHPKYNDKDYRAKEFENMAKDLCVTDIKWLKKNVCILRAQYNNEIRKVIRATQYFMRYEPLAPWFAVADKFLRIPTEKTIKIINDDDRKGIKKPKEPKKRIRIRKKVTNITDTTDEMQDIANSLEQMSKSLGNNEFTVFGTSIAQQMTKMPKEVAIELQAEIQTLITETRLNTLQSENPVKKKKNNRVVIKVDSI